MCGLVGIFSTGQIEKNEILSMTLCLSHRGPDAQKCFVNDNGTIALGHTRLSIIDLSHDADQPMFSYNKRYVIVFNGEIYNFPSLRNELQSLDATIQFQTKSDTEIILHAFMLWGCDMVNKLEGMFAIIIADQQENKFYIFRDRIGKKPLYYFKSKTLFVFASEIKALLKHPTINKGRQVDKKVIGTFLHLGYIPEPDTIYANIYKFPAGHSGELDAAMKFSTKAYWKIDELVKNLQIRNIKDAKNSLNNLLHDAVQKRLISDVPIGSFLSGGTDSSLITAIASKYVSTPLKTFSIGFKESEFNESLHAARVARHLGTDHTEYILAEREAVDLLENYLKHFDEPFADTSAIPTMLVSKLARKEVKVVLTGDGGDELFQGYGTYTWANRLDNNWWKVFKGPLRFTLNATGKSQWQRVAMLLKRPQIGGIRSHIFSQEQYLFTQREIKKGLLKDKSIFKTFDYLDNDSVETSSGEKQAIFDLKYYLKDDLLVKVDRASMFYGIECRCPLLDHHVIEYALSLHHSLKVKHGKSKWLLKELLSQYLPQDLVNRPKWGFSVPLAKWLKGDLKYLVDDYLNDRLIEEVGLFNTAYIQQLKKEFLGGKDYLYNRLWIIIVLHKWWKNNILS
jgi:asparagine synthase (glutamine-hydrolysing)